MIHRGKPGGSKLACNCCVRKCLGIIYSRQIFVSLYSFLKISTLHQPTSTKSEMPRCRINENVQEHAGQDPEAPIVSISLCWDLSTLSIKQRDHTSLVELNCN